RPVAVALNVPTHSTRSVSPTMLTVGSDASTESATWISGSSGPVASHAGSRRTAATKGSSDLQRTRPPAGSGVLSGMWCVRGPIVCDGWLGVRKLDLRERVRERVRERGSDEAGQCIDKVNDNHS